MKQFGLRYLYKHLGLALKQMPFEITNHNRVIAVVTREEVPTEYTQIIETKVEKKEDGTVEFN